MIGPHLAISDLSKSASSAGVDVTGEAAKAETARCGTGDQ